MKKLSLIVLSLLLCSFVLGCTKKPDHSNEDGSVSDASSTSEGTSETTTATPLPPLSLPDIQELFAEYQTRYSLSEIKQGESAITCKNGDFSLAITANANEKAESVLHWAVSLDLDVLYSYSAINLAEPLAVYASKATCKEVTAQHIVDCFSEVEAVESSDTTSITNTRTYIENGIQYDMELSGVILTESQVLYTLTFRATAVTDDTDSPAPSCNHNYTEATCTEPQVCTLCDAFGAPPAGHDWSYATCTTPETCSVCGETSGEAFGHDILLTKCQYCDEIEDFSCIAKSYTNLYAYDLMNATREYDVQNLSISSDGILSFTFNGKDYQLQLRQTDRWFENSTMLIFECYRDGILEHNATVMIDTVTLLPILEWYNQDGLGLCLCITTGF